jgi:DNA repair protein RadC
MSVNSTNQSSVLKVQEANGRYREAMAAEVLAAAEGVLSGMIVGTVLMNRPETAESYLKVKLAALEHEVFGCLFLDAAHKLIEYSELFRGTVNQTAVYPREVIKAALAVNSSAVIFFHNHPSGAAEPSRADELLTENLRKALLMIGVETLDHLIVARSTVVSMARRGCFAI